MLALLLLATTPILAQADRFGLPGCDQPGQELAARASFFFCHDAKLRAPVWTAHELTPSRLERRAVRPKGFRHDYLLAGASAFDADYRKSGWARGHFIPAADAAWSEEEIRATFLLSNVAPQSASLNLGKWRMLENAIRRRAAAADSAIVFTGAIYDAEPERIGRHRVAVPTYYYKVLVEVRGSRTERRAYLMENGENPEGPLERFKVTVDEVERKTGLLFPRGVRPLSETVADGQ